MDGLLDDLRISLRTLLVRSAFTLAAVLTLSLGIGSATTVFSVVFGVLIRPLPFPESDRLLALWQTQRDNPAPALEGAASPVNDDDWRRARTLESVALYSTTTAVLNEGNEPVVVPAARITLDFFRVLRRPLTLGREFTAEEDRPRGTDAVIIGHGLWQERFGGAADVLGRTLVVAGRSRPIVGVAPPDFDFPGGARIWVPVQNDDANCGRGCVYLNGVARLRAGASRLAAEQELRAMAVRIERDFPGDAAGTTFAATGLQKSIVGEVERPLFILLGAILMVLLVACANVANLLLVRGSGRTAEIAVRATLGASRLRLVRQMLTESLLLATFGGVLGVLLASWTLSAVVALSPGDLPRLNEVHLGLPSLAFALALCALTAFIFGLAPAFQTTRVNLAAALRQGGRGDTGQTRTVGRTLLLAAEVGFSVMLLLGAGLLVRSFLKIRSVDLGFEPAGVAHFTVSLPSARYATPDQRVAFYDELRNRLRNLPGVEDASITVAPPLGSDEIVSSFERTDRPPPEPGQGPSVVIRVADASYANLLRIPIVAGRNFTDGDRQGAPRVALITRAAAERFWRAEDPLGKQIDVGVFFGYSYNEPVTIVGVLDDIRGTGLTTGPEPELYVTSAQSGNPSATVLMRARGEPAQALNEARAELRRLDASLPNDPPRPAR